MPWSFLHLRGRLALLLVSSAVLSACGGGQPESPTADPAAAAGATREAAATSRKQALAAPANGIQSTLDWAEWKYPGLFAKGPASYSLSYLGVGYTVRSYASGNNLGITADGTIWGLGPFTNQVLTSFGKVTDFAAQVRADACAVYPGSCTAAGSLIGRTWAAGQRLNDSNAIVTVQNGAEPRAVIDADGRTHVMYLSNSLSTGQFELSVVTGRPGEFGAPPVQGSPVRLRQSATTAAVSDGVWLGANGSASALWTEVVACANDPQEKCLQNWRAAFDPATGTWGAGATISAAEGALVKGSFNTVGDQLALVPSALGTSVIPAFDLGWRQRGRTAIETLPLASGNVISDLYIASAKLALDDDGRIAMVYVRAGADGAANLIVRRGSIRNATLGPEELLESRNAPVTLNGFWSNAAGQVVVMWYQDDGTRVTLYASTLDSLAGSWTTTDLGARVTTDAYVLGALAAGGNFHAYSVGNCRSLRRVGGTWTGPAALPAGLCATSNQWAIDGSGNLLALNRTDGRWASFDAASQTVYQPFVNTTPSTGPGYVLGTRWNNLPGTLLLSDSGIGAFVTWNAFDALPSAASPNGDSRGANFRSVWSVYFK